MKRTLWKLTAWAALAPGLSGSVAVAQNTWTGGTGNWETPSNWSVGAPLTGTTVTLDNGGTAEVDTLVFEVPGRISVASVAGSSGTIDVKPNGNLAADRIVIGEAGAATAVVNDGFLIAGGGSLFVGSDQQNATGLSGSGVLTLNDGAVALSGDDFQVASQGTGVVNFNSGSYGSGIYTVVGKFGSATWNQAGGVYYHAGGDVEIGDGGRPDQFGTPGPREGTINLSGGAMRVSNALAIGNRIGTGEVNVSGGGLAITGDGASEIGDGRENILYIGRGADWTPADVAANGVTGNDVTFRVIGDDSVIAVGLDLVMDQNDVFASSTLVAQITGPTHTPILIGRNADIKNGDFRVELNGYSPVAGDEWSILQTNVDLSDALASFDAIVAAENVDFYDRVGNLLTDVPPIVHNNNAVTENANDPSYVGVDGPFQNVDFSAASLSAGLAFELEYLSDEVLLKVVSTGSLPGDFDGDNDVDGDD
ncbi:MAG: hypothetical protein KDA61_09675, partial [Planctomycetales bacterium]|nr:hypothetical protein [Planctomycetales bacterium]